jgi:uncharacterized protein HemX
MFDPPIAAGTAITTIGFGVNILATLGALAVSWGHHKGRAEATEAKVAALEQGLDDRLKGQSDRIHNLEVLLQAKADKADLTEFRIEMSEVRKRLDSIFALLTQSRRAGD